MSTWETFDCPQCHGTLELRIDLSQDRPLVVHCPECGTEQRFAIEDGRMTRIHD